MSEPTCSGPFSEARDCPVHGPEIRAEQAKLQHQAIAAAEARGRDAVLREVAKLPSPIVHDYPDWNRCEWCGVQILKTQSNTKKGTGHPDTDCLWPRALAAAAQKEEG